MPDGWLGISYKVPTEPSRKRVYVWRKLKDIGAVYLQQGVGLLPHSEDSLRELEQLRKEVFDMGGEAAVLSLSFLSAEDEQRLINDCQASRNQEYDEIIDKCGLLIEELEHETAISKFTFAEIEENEEELHKINRWLQKVVARDYFAAPGRLAALAIIEQATHRANQYAEEVYRREIPHIQGNQA